MQIPFNLKIKKRDDKSLTICENSEKSEENRVILEEKDKSNVNNIEKWHLIQAYGQAGNFTLLFTQLSPLLFVQLFTRFF